MTNFLPVDIVVDVTPLVAEIEAHPELWNAIDMRTTLRGTPHAGSSDIWLRYNDLAPYKRRGSFIGFNDPHVPIWYPAWDVLPEARPIVFSLAAKLEAEMIGAVLITKIPPGGRILKHVDSGWHVDYFRKFYVALQSEPGADFVCEHNGVEERLNPAVGSVYEFDNRKPHWVENDSGSDRMTLIICLRSDRPS